MSLELPEGWAVAPLGEIADHALGKMLDRAKNEGAFYPYLRNINVRWGSFNLTELLEMRFKPEELERFSLKPGDLIVCEGGEPGRCAIWHEKGSTILYQKALHRVRLNEGIMPEILLFHLKKDAESGQLAEHFTGTTIKHLTGRSLARYPVKLPPLPEQKRIVKKINHLKNHSRRARAALQAVEPLLEQFRQSVLASAFRGDLTADWRAQNPDVEPASKLLERIRRERRERWEQAELEKMRAKGREPRDDRWKKKYKEPVEVDRSGLPDLPKGWEWASLDELAYTIEGGTSGTATDTKTSRKVLRSSAIRHGNLNLSDFRYLPENVPQKPNPWLSEGDLLFTRLSGSLAYVGNCAIVPALNGLQLEFPDRFFRSICSNLTVKKYITLCFEDVYLRKQLESRAKSSAGHQRISLSDLRSFYLPLPPRNEQTEIIGIVGRLWSSIEVVTETKIKLHEAALRLDQSILTQAFQGQLVPQDPNDEPASVLLERIRKAREAQPKKKRGRRRRG